MNIKPIFIASSLCLLVFGCSHPVPPVPVTLTATSTQPMSAAITPPSVATLPPGNISPGDASTRSQIVQEGQAVKDYSVLFLQTLDIVKQAEASALGGGNGDESVHSRVADAQALMDKAEDNYSGQLSTAVGFGDVDSLLRDGMAQDKTAFNYLDFAAMSTDPSTTQDCHAKGEEACVNAGRDFQRARQMLDQHFDQVIQDAKALKQ